jgi:hypothetical protein
MRVYFGGPTLELLQQATGTSLCISIDDSTDCGFATTASAASVTGDDHACPTEFAELMRKAGKEPGVLLFTNNPYMLDHLNPDRDELIVVWGDTQIDFFKHEEYGEWTKVLSTGEAAMHYLRELWRKT